MNLRSKLSYLAMSVALIVLAATGIGTFAFGHPPMTHWVLMAHVAFAPLFALGLAGIALTWSGYCGCGKESRIKSPARCLFWVILVSGLIVLLSGVVPMTPIFGSNGQHTLYYTHRYSAVVLTVAVILQLLAFLRRG